MALNDNFAVMMGNTNDTRQPASGVFEKVTAFAKDGVADKLLLTDATLDNDILNGGVATDLPQGDAAATRQPTFNINIRIGNTVFIEKSGTIDHVAVSGVQTDV